MTLSETFARTERELTSGVYATRDIALVRGQGARVWDADGNEYIDCSSGYGVSNLGHAHPRVVEAIREQSGALLTCAGSFPNDRRAELLERLNDVLPESLDRFFFCNSGTESVEGAIKFARFATGRSGVVACLRAFHGRTLGSLSATWDRRHKESIAPLVPGFSHVPYDKLDRMSEAVTEDTAAVLVEVIQGEGGVHPASVEYLRGLRELCDERGVMLIFDEVQTGYGRTGNLFAFEDSGVVPDLLCLGKAIAGGVPMGAVCIGRRIGDIPVGMHGSTFGGNPLACAAAVATLETFREENLVERSRELGAWLFDRLSSLPSDRVRTLRGRGMMLGIELRSRVAPVLQHLIANGVIALAAGPSVLRLLPPLVIEREDLEVVSDKIQRALEETE